jgi:hypothetical protein
MSLLHGLQRDANGALQIQDGDLAITRVPQRGMQVSQDGELIVKFVPASLSNTRVRAGLLLASDGSLYVSTAAAQTVEKGAAYRTNRALCVTFDAPAATARYVDIPDIGRVLANTAGQVHVGGLSFVLDFPDAGSGAVTTTPITANTGVSATFTRAGATATTIGSTGLVIKAIGANVPRSYYDPTSLAYLGYLAEGARTNLHTQSEDSTNAAWTKTDTTPTISGTAPDGAATANVETEGTAGTAIVSQAVTGTADANYAVTRFLKRGNTDWVRITILNGANLVNGWFNLNTGVVGSTAVGGTGAAVAIRIKAFPSGWYRCELVGSVGSAATAITAGTSSASADANTTRVNNATYLWWGAGFENNVSFASTYIPTVGATATRAADVLGYAFAPTAPGTLFVAARAVNAPQTGDFAGFVALNDNTGNEEIYLGRNSGASRGFITDGGAAQAGLSIGTWADGASAKLAMAFATNDVAGVQDGGTVQTDALATMPTMTQINVGCRAGGLAHAYGPISRVNVFAINRSQFLTQMTT